MAKVSVVMPVYNGERFLAEAVQSVLDQRFADFELIVVNDGSSDGSLARLAVFPGVRVICQTNRGQSAARNRGVAESAGDYVAFIDQDDRWYPHKLSDQVRILDERPHIGLVYGDVDEIDSHGRLVSNGIIATYGFRHPKRSLIDCLSYDMFILPTAVMLRRALFETAGGFDERLSGYEDDDLFLRLFPLTRFHFEAEAVAQWRISKTSSSYTERMDVSRALYVTKLIERFPDEPAGRLYYVRDLIVPRFFRTYLACYWRMAEAGEMEKARKYRREMFAVLRGHMSALQRLVSVGLMGPRPLAVALRAVGRQLPTSFRRRWRL